MFIFVLGFFTSTAFSQAKTTSTTVTDNGVLDGGSYKKEHVQNRKPLPYQYVREADVMWSKTVWRKIDLREKMNLPLYYPETPMGTRFSLIDLLMKYIKDEKLTAYEAKPTQVNEFEKPILYKEVEALFDVKPQVKSVVDVETGVEHMDTIQGILKSSEVKEYLVKEIWFFDKQRSSLEVRIIGLCPIRYFYKPSDTEQEDPQKKQLFWVSFVEARKFFAMNEVFNAFNDAEYKTFDDIFAKRFFSSYIYKESNVYNNRQIDEYTTGIETLLEAEKIKQNMQNFESDLWEY